MQYINPPFLNPRCRSYLSAFPPFCLPLSVAASLLMEKSEAATLKTITTRHRCSACFKQYKKKEHLIAHMKVAYHSVHQPRCVVCQKHCKSLESLREHLTGPLPKENCSKIFADQGCDLCLKIFENPDSLNVHKELCRLATPASFGTTSIPLLEYRIQYLGLTDESHAARSLHAVALDCEMVGGGSDGSLDLCARVCIIDEAENVVFHSYVLPQIPVTDYRYEVTGLTEEHLIDAMPLKDVREKIIEILYNGESIGRLRLDGGKAKLLVGHDLEHDLHCLEMSYPDHLLRDTAKYRPLMKTNLVSHPLKYLTRTYLGYDIQSGMHDPYEDCVSAMRLYKRMRSQDHPVEGIGMSVSFFHTQTVTTNFDSFRPRQLEKMSPDELYEISKSNYRCWCLDSRVTIQP